ncbi:MAG: hypothetical protein LBI70_01985 [Rickettsiales bacterium]|jgi:hypothetical protein|nr:hypothetical protein [Rickettsiales bacterium]
MSEDLGKRLLEFLDSEDLDLGSEKDLLQNKIFEYNEKSKRLEKVDEVTKENIKILRKSQLLDESFDINKEYFPLEFVKIMANILKEKFPDISRELPINVIDCSGKGSSDKIEPTSGPGFDIIYGLSHTTLVLKKYEKATDETEIYVMDSYINEENEYIDEIYSDKNKFNVRYPNTPTSKRLMKEMCELVDRRKDYREDPGLEEQIKSKKNKIYDLEIQKDTFNCISYALQFTDTICDHIKDKMTSTGKSSATEAFDSILGEFNCYTENTPEIKLNGPMRGDSRAVFDMPGFIIGYSESEKTLDEARLSGVAIEDKRMNELLAFKAERREIQEKIMEVLEARLIPLKKKRDDLEKNKEKNKGEINALEIDKEIDAVKSKISFIEDRKKFEVRMVLERAFTPPSNVRVKHIKEVALKLKENEAKKPGGKSMSF